MQVFTSKYWLLLIIGIVILVRGDDDECVKKTSHLPSVRLKKDLLCDYDKTIRPVVNHTNATTVTVKMILKYFNYDVHTMSMSIHSWIALVWKDEHLQWKPADYQSLDQIHISSDEIWNPDFSVYNSDDQGQSPGTLNTVKCLLLHTGMVVCLIPSKHDARCAPNIKQFPFDRQNCTIRYGSWVHSGEELDFKISKPPVTMDDYLPNADWKLDSIKVYMHAGHFNCCPDNSYPSINYNFVLDRYSGTNAALIIVPALVLIVLSLATVCMSPLESERLTVACCNFFVHNLDIQFTYWMIPNGGDNPALLVLFLRDSLIMCTISLILTVVLKHLIKKNTPCPKWISSMTSSIISIPYVQVLLIRDGNPKGVVILGDDEDTTDIVENNTESLSRKDWQIFAHIIDRISVIVYIIVYFFMFLSLMP